MRSRPLGSKVMGLQIGGFARSSLLGKMGQARKGAARSETIDAQRGTGLR